MTTVEMSLLIELPSEGALRDDDFDRLDRVLRGLIVNRRPRHTCDVARCRQCCEAAGTRIGG